ncbi:MAG: T9SS type A sorting domain-containing protein [Cyclobacteriaceae bacterium]
MRLIITIAILMNLMVHTLTLAIHPLDNGINFRARGGTEENTFVNPTVELMAINPVSVQVTLRDRSNDDTFYEIYRSLSGSGTRVLVRSFAAPDSGGFYIVLDHPQPMVYNAAWTYTVDATVNGTVYPSVTSATVNTANYNPMSYPTFQSRPGVPVTETSIAIDFRNPVPGALTEIYRAPTHEGPFGLLATRGGETGRYVDTGLTQGTPYYYTLRGVLGGQTSTFAGITGMSTLEVFKIADFEAEAMPDGSVHITLHDRGLSDLRYELIREGGEEGVLLETFVLPDSGTVVNYIDDYVLPDITYVYILDVFLQGGGGSTVGMDTVTTFATEADLGYFYMVDPFYDGKMEYYVTDGFVNVFPDMNIVVEANDLTKSVVFSLNGKQSIDNVPPFAVLPDTNGDFESLNLPNGEYKLTAIAYPGQNAGGTPTDTLSATFTVHIETCAEIGCFTLVNADTDQDIGSIEEGETFVKPANSYFNVRFNAVYNPGSVEFKIEDNIYRVENAAPFSLAGDLSGNYMPWKAGLAGTYSIEATPYTGPNRTGIRGNTVSISFTIIQPEITESGFTIVNADTDEDIQPLNNGDVFVKASGTRINIRYDAINNPGSVLFKHQNKEVRMENAAPFAIGGDYNGNYLPWGGAVAGEHRIDVIPYSLDRKQGTAGTPLTVNFTIAEEGHLAAASTESGLVPLNVYPNPAPGGQTELTISGQRGKDRTAAFVEIIDMRGDVVFSEQINCGDCDTYAMQVKKNLLPGVYIVRVKNDDNRFVKRLLIK